MELTGRLVADATIRAVNADKNVTGFTVAVNRRYKAQGEQREETSFVDCTYWRGEGIAPYLTKGMVEHLSGFMTAQPWVSRDGEAMASLKFRTDEITMLSASSKKNIQAKNTPKQTGNATNAIKPSKRFN